MTKQSEANKDHRKPCTLCKEKRDVLIRCQIDSTGAWHMVCPGKCWRDVSGGMVDGDQTEDHKYYRYGGMWKNKHEAVSAKMPKGKSKKVVSGAAEAGNDEETTATSEQ
ncbi:hypothetical protein KC333_g6960 [Hortaea werneckii]|nr:hypothetical protein KC333_g6960 [Hortaea werneckii]KAI7309764.1 hypothetical protein KC326_g6925 [Hortaea werneckii]